MSCISFLNTCPSSGDPSNVLLAKILQVLNEGGGGGGAGVSAISVNGGPNETGVVSLTIPGGTVTSVNGDPGPAVSLDTSEIPEGGGVLYFTEARVRATVLTGFASALGAISAADSVLSAFGKTQGRLAALEAGTAGPFLLDTGDTGSGAYLFTMSANDVVPLTLTSTAGSLTTSNNLVVNYGAANLLTLRNDGRLVLNGRAAFLTTSSLGHGFRVSDANTATAVIVGTLGHNLSAGVGANGIGAHLDWTLDSSTTADTRAARETVTWVNATHAARTASRTFLTFNAGTEGIDLILTTGQIQSSGGTVALPAFSNRNDPDTGIYFPGANQLGFAAAGVEYAMLDSTAFSVLGGAQLIITRGTITANTPSIDITSTWNNGGVTFSGFRFVITDTASAAASLFTEFLVGAASRFSVRKDGLVTAVAVGAGAGLIYAGAFSAATGILFGSAAVTAWGSGAGVSGGSAGDTFLRRNAATTLSLDNLAASAATLRVAETTDAGLTNYSRTTITTQAGNHLIRTEAAGTGTLRILQVGTGPKVGTDIAGVDVIFHSGQPTGNAAPGAILFQQGLPAGASGTGVTALATIWSIDTAGHLTATEARNIIVGTTTGTKIATATSQKLGFWNATPIVQPTTADAAATFVANTSLIANDSATFDGYTIGQVVKALRNAGLLA